MNCILYFKGTNEITDIIYNVVNIQGNNIYGADTSLLEVNLNNMDYIVTDYNPKISREDLVLKLISGEKVILPDNLEDFRENFIKIDRMQELENAMLELTEMLAIAQGGKMNVQ
ncbi:hypothetical protein [Clostridium sp. UBA6640]|uniref:hypothetical protein n=1 Tax=Clostridium sp. UBA6640 TaxID=1946370 RepID=UPI0025C33BC0|nr:hypothetical protein [Clostridium sp. UBA6640]